MAEMARRVGLSVPRFHARFKEQFGMPPAEYLLRAKVTEACRQLRETRQPITAIAYKLGFSSSQYFATVVKRYTGQTPRALRAARGPL